MIDFIKKNKIIISISIVLIISGVFFILFNSKNKKEVFFKEINAIDKNIDSGFYRNASEQLDELYHEINNSKDAIIFLKRAYKLASEENNYRNLSIYAEKLSIRFKNNIEIIAVNTFAKQKTGNYGKALEISEKKISRSDYSSLYYLSVLKTGLVIDDKSIIKSIPEEFLFLFENTMITPDILLKSAGLNYDERYYLDASLLYLTEGLREEAWNCINKIKQDSYNEFKMYLAYDNEDFTGAEKYFRQMNDLERNDYYNMLTGCDILLRNGKSVEASEYYKKMISENSFESSIPFRNLYSMERSNGTGYKWLAEGLKIFPENEELILAFSWEIFISNDMERLSALPYFTGENNNELIKLFEVSLLQGNRSPEYLIGSYWNLFNMKPQSESIAVAFANFLIKNRQYNQLRLLVEKYNKTNGISAWTEEYSAILNALEGNIEEAILYSESALSIKENTRNLFNHAVINELNGNYKKAIETLERVLLEEESIQTDKDVIGKTCYKLAEIHYNLNEKDIAYNYLKKSLDNDYDKLKCSLLLRRIQDK